MPEPQIHSPRILGLCAGNTGRTCAAVSSFLAHSEQAGATIEHLDIDGTDGGPLARAMSAADGILLASPVYRASCRAAVRAVLETTGRGRYDDDSAPLAGKPCSILLTGGSAHHFLALNDLRGVLASFFAAQVMSPGLYLTPDAFESGRLSPDGEDLVNAHAGGFVEFTDLLRGASAVRRLEPQA